MHHVGHLPRIHMYEYSIYCRRVIGRLKTWFLSCRFCGKWMREYYFLFSPINLLILLAVTFGRWSVRACVCVCVRVWWVYDLYLQGFKLKTVYYKRYLDKSCGVQIWWVDKRILENKLKVDTKQLRRGKYRTIKVRSEI